MILLENPTTYNLSESNFNIGVAIYDVLAREFVDLEYFRALLYTQTLVGS
jgi:hypothetical protein